MTSASLSCLGGVPHSPQRLHPCSGCGGCSQALGTTSSHSDLQGLDLILGEGFWGHLGHRQGLGSTPLCFAYSNQASGPGTSSGKQIFARSKPGLSATPPSQHVYSDTHTHAPTITHRHTRNHTKHTATGTYITHTHTTHKYTQTQTHPDMCPQRHTRTTTQDTRAREETHTLIYTVMHTQPPTQTHTDTPNTHTHTHRHNHTHRHKIHTGVWGGWLNLWWIIPCISS